MLILNPLKPFYIDKNDKKIRMGNFKNTGKELYYDNDNFIKILDFLKEPISKEELINKILEQTNVLKEDIINIIDYLIEENFIIKKSDYDNLLSDKKFSRQNLYFSMLNNNVDKNNINIIKDKKILILGLGGIGANVALLLSRSGFNNFILVDCDSVEESNLIRQLPYNEDDIGKLKTECLKSKLSKNNNIDIVNKKILNENDIIKEIKKSDFVLCTLDKPSRIIRRLINNICVKEKKPVLFSGFSEYVAMIGPFVVPNKTACLMCIEKEEQETPLNNVKIVPSYGPLCLLISSIVSNEIINYFLKFNSTNLEGKTMMFDLVNYDKKIIKWKRNNKCKVCE